MPRGSRKGRPPLIGRRGDARAFLGDRCNKALGAQLAKGLAKGGSRNSKSRNEFTFNKAFTRSQLEAENRVSKELDRLFTIGTGDFVIDLFGFSAKRRPEGSHLSTIRISFQIRHD